ncbi:MAG TPA: PPOX class F420-dependent oxidoreductase [Cryptosporangiaceae bacterium]|nr:PPOX class F420-dependent oxidoreductase [Cryptosporangiaceae bacterium]
MDLDEARSVVREQPKAVIAVRRPDGSPLMSPVLVAVGDDGRLMLSTRETAYKVRHLRRDPRAWLCVLPDGFFGRWISVEATAEVVSLPDAMELLVDYYKRTAGEHPDWDDYRAAMERDQRVMVLLTPVAAGPDRSG